MYVKRKRGTSTAMSSYVGPEHTLTIDTDSNTINSHDGVTVGGVSASPVFNLPPNDGKLYIWRDSSWVEA